MVTTKSRSEGGLRLNGKDINMGEAKRRRWARRQAGHSMRSLVTAIAERKTFLPAETDNRLVVEIERQWSGLITL